MAMDVALHPSLFTFRAALPASRGFAPGPIAATWTAIVLAGRRPGPCPLASSFGVISKALIPVDGEAMLSRVTRSLLASGSVRRVIILAQEAEDLLQSPAMAWARYDGRVEPRRSADGISRSIDAVLAHPDTGWPVLVTTADHALLTPEVVRAFTDHAENCDLAVGLVDRETLLAAYPDNRRTWLRFKGGAYTGANLFALHSPATRGVLKIWASVEQDRKKLWRIARRFGPWLLLRTLLRRMSIQQAVAEVGWRMGVLARPVLLPFAEAGIDVDKAGDYQLAEAILRRRATA
ncbi:MAG: nucleotidyltransferase family protein [Sphingomonadaceae bacterium]